jgi:hypothetical protein
MRVIIKIALTLLVFIIATPISVAAKQVPFLNLVLFAGIIAGIVAIWKYDPSKNSESSDIEISDNNDKHKLDKSQ